jgi:hypothetical protein
VLPAFAAAASSELPPAPWPAPPAEPVTLPLASIGGRAAASAGAHIRVPTRQVQARIAPAWAGWEREATATERGCATARAARETARDINETARGARETEVSLWVFIG